MNDCPALLKIIFSFLCAFFALFASGCSDSEPKLSSVEGIVVFDFEDETSAPDARLSVFAETESDAHRVEKITVSSRSTQFEWTAFEPVIIANEKKQWAGYTDFVCPAFRKIPAGLYRLVYTDGEGREVESSFSIVYPEKIGAASAADIKNVLDGEFFEQVAVFDETDALLYYGLKKESWAEDKKLFSANKGASYYRTCLVVKNATAVCILPTVYKDQRS